MQRQRKTNLAIQELGLEVDHLNQNDKYELTDLLCEMLGYPTIEEAQMHRQANRLGNFDLLTEQTRLIELLNSKNTQELKLCPCCGNIVNQTDIPFWTPLEQVRLGVGVRLYFLTVLYHSAIFLGAFFIYSLYVIVTNLAASSQSSSKICEVTCPTARLGLGGKLDQYQQFKSYMAVQAVLGFVLVVLWSFLMLLKYRSEGTIQSSLKNEWLSSSEFTLMLKNFPLELLNPRNSEDTLSNIRKVFKDYEQRIKSRISLEVVKVSIGYPLYLWERKNQEHLKKTEEQIKEKRRLFTQLIKQRMTLRHFTMSQERRNEEYEQFYQLITNQDYERNNSLPDLQQKNVLFVTLRYSKAASLLQQIHESAPWWMPCLNTLNPKTAFPIDGVSIKKAPQPDEIKWENIGFDQCLKIKRRIFIYGLALLLIGITLTISIFLGKVQSQKPTMVAVVISILITLFNFLIELLIIQLSSYEGEFQKSKEEASIGIKIAVSQIMNSIGVPVILASIRSIPIYQEGGLVTNVFFISLINMLLPIGRLIDPYNLLLRLRQYYYLDPQKRLELEGQPEMNKIYSCYEFELGYQYAYIIKTAYFTGFFLALQPIIGIFAPVGLILMFWVNKYRLLYRFNKPNFHSSSVNTLLAFILKCSLVAFAMGQLFFMNFQNYSSNFNLIINWVSLAITAIFVCLPLHWLTPNNKSSSPSLDYQQQLLYLTTDYDRLNPVTKEQAINEFRDFLEQYEKKCHHPLPQKSEIILRSMAEMSKMVSGMSKQPSASILNFVREKTKLHPLGSGMHTNDRLR